MTARTTPTATSRTCPDCGYRNTYQSIALADYHFPKHSCAKQRETDARARRVAHRAANRGGVKRDCACARADHRHGTRLAYVIDRCRCVSCLDASIAVERKRRRDRLYGRPTERVAAEPVREHLRWLMSQGTSYKSAARVAGLPLTTVSQFLYGKPDRRNHQPPYTCTAEFAAKVLALRPDPWLLPDRCRVDATGTHRRVQALVVLGWSQSQLCARVGVQRANWFTMMNAQQVTARTARAIRDMYEQLWNAAPPESTHHERAAVLRARRHAADRRWLPPMAWDDDTIDDPDAAQVISTEPASDEIAIERAMRGDPPAHLGKADREEAVRRMTALGLSARVISERLHTSARAVQRDRGRSRMTLQIRTDARHSDPGWTTDRTDWRDRAFCLGADPRLFDEPGVELEKQRRARYSQAVWCCNRCPVAAECLNDARLRRDSGFRGGVLLNNGRPDRRGRPGPPLQPCGTEAAYRRHRRRRQVPCPQCAAAHVRANRSGT